jgi:hypothetical protein
MKPYQHTPEQIIKIIEQAEKGEHSIAAICREHGIAENTFYPGAKPTAVCRSTRYSGSRSSKRRIPGSSGCWLSGCSRTICVKSCSKKGLTMAEQREAVTFLVAGGLSVPRACVLVHMARSTFRSVAQPRDDSELLAQIREMVARNPRYGYRRISVLLRRTARINEKRVRRLWRQERLQVQCVRWRRVRSPRWARFAAAYPGQS